MPVEVSNSKSFIFNKGQLGMRVELDRDVYFPGDEVKMKLEVNNASVKKVLLATTQGAEQHKGACC